VGGDKPLKTAVALTLILAAQTCSASLISEQSPNLVGRWQLDIAFSDTDLHSLRFDAQASGKGSFLLLDPRSSLVEPDDAKTAEWSQTANKGVTFSGPVEFPIGNVGRDPGLLVFKGTFETDDRISGDVKFFPMGQDPKDPKAKPSRTGKFKATRGASADSHP